MSFTDSELSQLNSLLATSDGGPQLAAQFRALMPGRSLTRCEVSDMGADEPYRRFDAVDLHLVDGRDHCWRLTRDPACATGVVLAVRRSRP